MNIIEATHISKSFGSLKAVDQVSFSLPEGKTLAIVGESGCGKTTIARMIAGLITPDHGKIVTRAPIQMVFQDPYSSLDPLYTIERILMESFYQQHVLKRDQRLEKIKEVILVLGLEENMLGRFSHEFSGGQRQRIAIARALLANPKVLVLDEITSSLDVIVQRQMLEVLQKVKTQFKLSYVFISHNLRVVKSFADTIAVMKQGEIIESGDAVDVLDNPKMLYTKELVRAALTYRCEPNE